MNTTSHTSDFNLKGFVEELQIFLVEAHIVKHDVVVKNDKSFAVTEVYQG